MQEMPAVIAVLAVEIGEMIVVQVLCKDAVVEFLFRIAAVLNGSKFLIRIAAARHNESTASSRGLFRDDVDDAVHGVGSPDCPAWTADYLDAIDVLQRHVQGVPVHASEKWGVHGPSVDQHKQFVGKLKVETTSRDGPSVGVNLSHIQSRHHAQ